MHSYIRDKWAPAQLSIFSIAMLIFLVSGCSRSEFAYRNADWFIEAYVSKTVAATDEQLEQWRPTLEHALEAHRRELLPLVIGYLEVLDRASRFPEDANLTDCVVNAGTYLYERHARLAVDLAAPLLTTLDSSQIRHLAGYLEQDQETLHKRYLKSSPTSQQEARVERFIERTEKWTGRLNERQVVALTQAINQIPDLSEYWLEYRTRQHRVLLEILEADHDTKRLRNHLTAWWVRFDHRPPEYVRDSELAKQGFSQFLQQLSRLLTERQRTRVQKRLASLRQGFEPFLPPGHPIKLPDLLLCTGMTNGELSSRNPL
jgi:hypothetical protein